MAFISQLARVCDSSLLLFWSLVFVSPGHNIADNELDLRHLRPFSSSELKK